MTDKNTHTVAQLEKLMYEYVEMFKNAHTKEEKKVINKKRKEIEQLWNNVSDKKLNGKHYPVKKKGIDVPKKELLALIDSVYDNQSKINIDLGMRKCERVIESGLDESGINPGSDRFSFVEKGWPEPKFVNRKTSISSFKEQITGNEDYRM